MTSLSKRRHKSTVSVKNFSFSVLVSFLWERVGEEGGEGGKEGEGGEEGEGEEEVAGKEGEGGVVEEGEEEEEEEEEDVSFLVNFAKIKERRRWRTPTYEEIISNLALITPIPACVRGGRGGERGVRK